MSAQLKLPDEFNLTTSPSYPEGNREKKRLVRRDPGARGTTHRVKIGDMVLSNEPAVALAGSDLTEQATRVSSPPNIEGEQEERMSPSNRREPKVAREIIVRTWPLALFLALAVWAVDFDQGRIIERAIVLIVGIVLVLLMFYFWFPRNEQRQGKPDISSREKLS